MVEPIAEPVVEPEKRGPGRPSKATKNLGRKAEVDGLVSDHMLVTFENLRKLADGEAKRVTVKLKAAGTITRKDVLRNAAGDPVLDKNQRPTVVEVLAFPLLDPDAMVEVERTETTLEEDFKANEHLYNRFDGRPSESVPEEDDGLKMREAIEEAEELLRGMLGGAAVWPIAADDAEADEAATDE